MIITNTRQNFLKFASRPVSFLFLSLLLQVSCSSGKETTNSNENSMNPSTWKIQWNENLPEQEAKFFVSDGWTGGFGEAALDSPDGRPLKFQDRATYLSGNAEKAIKAEFEQPACYSGSPLIFVHAKIRLSVQKSRNYSIPGAPEKSYGLLEIEELLEVKTHFTPCKE